MHNQSPNQEKEISLNFEKLKKLESYFEGKEELFEDSLEAPKEIFLSGQTKFILSEKTLKLEHMGLALGRCDLLGEQGFDCNEMDSIRFAKDFAAFMANRLSLYDLEILAKAFTRELRNSEYRHKLAIANQTKINNSR